MTEHEANFATTTHEPTDTWAVIDLRTREFVAYRLDCDLAHVIADGLNETDAGYVGMEVLDA